MGLGHSPGIITDGLIFASDPANPKNHNLTEVEVLVVAGGGGGGGRHAGGGGGGGVIYNPNFIVNPGIALTVTVGAGGAVATYGGRGGNGGNSVFDSLTAIGGGGGGGYDNGNPTVNGSTGGSGGGGAAATGLPGGNGTGASGTSGQGNAGATPISFSDWAGGGGGGAGENGYAPNGFIGGNGGSGLGFNISGSFTYYGGGGGGAGGNNIDSNGGLGGRGGGGRGTGAYNPTQATAGQSNTGGGGGGSRDQAGPAGGSGIVIVRYPGPQKAIGGTVTSVGGYTIHTFTSTGSTTFTPLVGTHSSTTLGLADISGNNRFVTTQNSPNFSSSNSGSIGFDGINEYSTFSISNPTTQITVETWIYPRRAPSTSTIRGAALSGEPNHYLGILDSIDGGVTHSLHWALQTSSTRPGSQVGNIPRYDWSHIAGTYDGSRLKAYLNGSLVYDVALTGTISGNGSWVLGTYYPTLTDGTHNFDGFIGPSRIYNRALTVTEIQQNYNAFKGRYQKGGINNPFSSPSEARMLGYTSGDYYFKSGSMSSPQLLEFQRNYYENKGWVCVFRSPYRSTATTNKIDLSIPMGGLLVQRDALDLRSAVYWSTPITYNTVGGSGNNTSDYGYSPRRVILGNSGGHGIFATNQVQCNWATATGAIGAGWDGTTCGSFPNDLVWGTGRSDTATYDNRSGIWSHWITW